MSTKTDHEEMCRDYRRNIKAILSDMKRRREVANHQDEVVTGYSVTYSGEFGLEGEIQVYGNGICSYKFERTGYDGPFRIEGRCYVADAERFIAMFFDEDMTVS